MKTTQQNENVKITFTMIDDNLLSTPVSRITAQQKLFISWILRFQKNNLECFATNKTIAETLGMTKDGVKSLIKSCSHSFPFFTCTPDTRENGVPFHTLSIDLEKLFKFITNDEPVAKIKRRNKPSTENKATETTISTQPIVETQVEENVSEIEAIQLIEDEVQITNDIFELTNREIQDMGYSKEKIGNWIVPNAYVPYLHLIQDYKGIIKTLMNEYSQINFEIELRNKLEYYKNKTEIILT